MEMVLRRNCGDPGTLANGGLPAVAETAPIDLRTMLLSTWIASASFTDLDSASHDPRRAWGRPVARANGGRAGEKGLTLTATTPQGGGRAGGEY